MLVLERAFRLAMPHDFAESEMKAMKQASLGCAVLERIL